MSASMMMDNIVAPSRKSSVVCRYFSASGTCFYGNDCQFLHSNMSRVSISPTFPSSLYSSPARSRNSLTSDSPSEFSHMENSRSVIPPSNLNPLSSMNTIKDSLSHISQEMSSSKSHHSGNIINPLFEETIASTTYYYPPEEEISPELEDMKSMESQHMNNKGSSHLSSLMERGNPSPTSSSQQHSYPGPPSFLQSSISGQQRASFFMSEDVRSDIIQRNSLAIASVDPASFPDLPFEVDHYRDLVPLEPNTLNQAVKSQTYGLITSTYKATHTRTEMRYCLKRIHGYRVTSAKCMSMVDMWRKVQQCHLVTLREVFTTKAFGDHSMVFVYDYYPGAETLLAKYLNSTTPQLDPFSSDPTAPRPYSMQKNRMLQQQAGKGLLSESLLWSYIIELCSALRSVHTAGLAVRALDPSKVLLTSRGRLRLCGGGIFDVLTYDANSANISALIPHYQQEDLLALGKLILALACNSMLALQRDNVPTSMDIINKNYSSDLRNLIVYLLSTTQGSRVKSIQEVMPMIGARFFSQLEAATLHADVLEDQLARELNNGRLFRLLCKIGTVVDRAELNLDSTWSETGDRYLLKLFRDYILHPCADDGRPWIDLAHVVACLNRLDAASQDKICLTSRDQQNVLVVSYGELHHCLETSFAELQQAALASHDHMSEPPATIE